MESLALLAALVVVTAVGSGPLAVLASVCGFRYIGATLGVFAFISGVWLASVNEGISLFGLVSAAAGCWCVLQVCQRTPPQ